MKKRLGAIFLTILCFAHTLWIEASPDDTIFLKGDTTLENFNSKVKFFIDSADEFDVSTLKSESFVAQFNNDFDDKYHNEGSIWARFFIQYDGLNVTSYILEVGGDKEIIVYYKTVNSEEFNFKLTGRFVPFPKNELGDFHFKNNKVQIELTPHSKYEIVLFYPNKGKEDVRPAFRIYSVENWHYEVNKSDAKINFWLGLFFGICFVLSVINFIYYFIHKDIAYINYAVYILTVIYYEASIYGKLDLLFLTKNPMLYNVLENTSLIFFVICYLLFLKSFINTKARFPVWDRVANYLILGLVFNGLLCFVLVYFYELPHTAMEMRNIILLCTLPFAAVFLYYIYINGTKVDHIFIAGSSVLVLTGLIGLVTSIFFLYRNADLIFQSGVVIELIVFNIGLGVKSRFHEKEKQTAQANLIDQLKENESLQISVNQELELKVLERTTEIQSQNEELAAQRDSLEAQNMVIAQSMKELETIKSELELIVKERTAQLQDANKELLQHNSQLEQYAYITAHNLRAPVARLKGLVYILEKSAGINMGNREVIKKIINSALEMDEVLSDMNAILEIKNKDNGQPKKVSILKIIEKVKRILAENIKEFETEIILKVDVKELTAYEPYLESIIYNLVSNGIKYRSQKRKLKIIIETFQENSDVVIIVSDNGLGIDLEKYREKMFGLYQRFHDHTGGKGLGLYLVKTQVESLGGSIRINSEPDKGTSFTILLPLN